ncbi:vWA domain-containing protein [Deinococcus fonticola]|uniref:vWA domain-containing protein n=1 Tax=Deinococcus fonticola TaxID=2528713 RepID=UPI0010751C95|nr:VWA domain-containing protein [Deinococcus fonticola]
MQDQPLLPRIELLPLKAALPAGQDSELTVLARLSPAQPVDTSGPRPPLNLALVIDRSGSMSGHPLAMARQAAQAGIRLLEPHDRVSVVIFDDEVETLIPSQQVTDPEKLCCEIERITSGGSTALHAGWLDGAMQVAQFTDQRALNRVLLLSDGQANQGKRHISEIVPDVRGLTARQVSTSTMGLGRHYDEDLLRGMAEAGDGNFEHIEHASQLPGFFETEFHGMSRTTGHTVSLGIEPNPEVGSLRTEILNDLQMNDLRRAQLPNLIAGRPLEVVFTLQVPAQAEQAEQGVLRVRLAWTGRDGIRRKQRAQLNMPVLPGEQFDALTENADVRVALEVQLNAKAKRDAVHLMDRGDYAGSQRVLRNRQDVYAAHAPMAPAPVREQELAEMSELIDGLMEDRQLTRKRAASQNYNRSRSK